MFAVDIAAVLLASLLIMVLMGVHIAIALGMASALGIYLVTGSFAVVERMLASTAYEALRDTPYWVALLLSVGLICLFPGIATFLPDLMFGRPVGG